MNENKKAQLIEGPVGRMLIMMTLPMIFGHLSIMLFNLVDTYFVGRLGTNELAALSFTFPVVLVIASLTVGLGIGASAIISRAVGEENHTLVRRLTTDSLLLSIVIVVFFIAIGLVTIDPLFRLLGASDVVLSLIREYMKIWYLGMAFLIIPMVGNNAIRATGDMITPSLIMILGGSVNAILDPILIFGWGPIPRLEIAGAAIATVLARALTMSISLYVLSHREKMITYKLVPFKTALASWKQILYIGIPSAGTRIILPVSVGVVTGLLAKYGAETVAAFGVATRIEFLAMTVVMALATIIGPFAGQNLGAGKFHRVMSGMKYSTRFSILWSILVYGILALTARPIATIFNDEASVISTIVLYFRIVPIAYGLQGIVMIATSTLNVLKKPLHAASLNIVQTFGMYVPLAIAGSYLFGIPGVFGAIAVSYAVSGIAGYVLLMKMLAVEEAG